MTRLTNNLAILRNCLGGYEVYKGEGSARQK